MGKERKRRGHGKGHLQASWVFGIARTRLPTKFSAMMSVVRNGWAVRQLQNIAGCQVASGVDGSLDMMKKARKIHPVGDISMDNFQLGSQTNSMAVVSMEFMYYLEDPFSFHWHRRLGLTAMDA